MEQGRIGDTILTVATVLYLLFLPLYPITASLMEDMTSNTVIAWATATNAGVAIIYALFTWGLWRETRSAAQTTCRMFEAGHRPWVQLLLQRSNS